MVDKIEVDINITNQEGNMTESNLKKELSSLKALFQRRVPKFSRGIFASFTNTEEPLKNKVLEMLTTIRRLQQTFLAKEEQKVAPEIEPKSKGPGSAPTA